MGNRRLGAARLASVYKHMEASASVGGRYGFGSDRIYLEENFYQRPGLNEDLSGSANGNFFSTTNKNFEVLGTNSTTALVTFASASCGITLTTATALNDQMTIIPHADTNQTLWAQAGKGGTENQTECEFIIQTHGLVDQSLMIGLGHAAIGTTFTYTHQDDAVWFVHTNDDSAGALTANDKWHVVVCIGGTDYITNTGVSVVADQIYRLGIKVDSDRKASAYIDGKQYSLTQATTAGGVLTGKGTTKSPALTNDKNLLPCAGVQNDNNAGQGEALTINCIRYSMNPKPV